MSDSQNHTSIEDTLTEAHRVLSLLDDMATGFAANPDTVELRAETWWLLSDLTADAKKGLAAVADALPGSVMVTNVDDWATGKPAATVGTPDAA